MATCGTPRRVHSLLSHPLGDALSLFGITTFLTDAHCDAPSLRMSMRPRLGTMRLHRRTMPERDAGSFILPLLLPTSHDYERLLTTPDDL